MMEKTKILEMLIGYCPALEKDVEAYCKDFSEIYLHLIFGDIFNPYMLELLEDAQKNGDQLTRIAHLLESMSEMSESVQEVVVTTVLERLMDKPEILMCFKKFAGQKTTHFIEELL